MEGGDYVEVLLPLLVVTKEPLLNRLFNGLKGNAPSFAIRCLGYGKLCAEFQEVQKASCISVGLFHKKFAGLLFNGKPECSKAPLPVRKGPVNDAQEGLFV